MVFSLMCIGRLARSAAGLRGRGQPYLQAEARRGGIAAL